jgi:hypothetical protein
MKMKRVYELCNVITAVLYFSQPPLLVPSKNIYQCNLFCTHCFPSLTAVAAGGLGDTDSVAGDQQAVLMLAVLG